MSTFNDRKETYLWKKEQDYKFGEFNEMKYGKQILQFFGVADNNTTTIVRHHRYQVIDWVITKISTELNPITKRKKQHKDITLIELKTRTCSLNKYKSTMYPINKFRKQIENIIKNKVVKAYCVFIFSDCIAYYEITQDSEKEITIDVGGRSDRGMRESSTYAYIPIDKLKIIEQFVHQHVELVNELY